MKLEITHSKTVAQLQIDFNIWYPYLRIEFLKKGLCLGDINKNIGDCMLELPDNTSIAEMENIFSVNMGLPVRILRKSGNIWMETSITGHWTLAQQNQHGKEISLSARV